MFSKTIWNLEFFLFFQTFKFEKIAKFYQNSGAAFNLATTVATLTIFSISKPVSGMDAPKDGIISAYTLHI